MPVLTSLALAALLGAGPSAAAQADELTPEIKRSAPATAQAVGARHSVRQIPEACVRFEGVFTGDAAQPYRLTAVSTGAHCQPRARLLDAATAQPDPASGWRLNDLIRIPNASCAGQQAIVRIWRKPVTVTPPSRDGQGQARIYLEDAKQDIASGKVAQTPIPLFSAQMSLEGQCQPTGLR